jgi:tetratricopeptide (TPR) repeat protein
MFGQALRRKDQASALPHLANAIEIARRVGDKAVEEGATNETALVHWKLSHLTKARAGFEEAAKLAAASGSTHGELRALDNLATVIGDLGDVREALAAHQDMAKRYLETRSLEDYAITRNDEAEILLNMGDLEGATTSLDEGERETSGARKIETTLSYQATRAEIVEQRGEFEKARALYRSAIEERQKTGDTYMSGRWERSLAAMEVAHGVSRTIDLRRWAKSDPDDARNRAALAASLAIDGNPTEAAAEARRAIATGAKTEVYLDRALASLLAAGALARTGARAEAVAIAEPIARDAESRGLLRWALEGRLVQAEASSGDDALARLDAVERDARARGLVAVADRAAMARALRR